MGKVSGKHNLKGRGGDKELLIGLDQFMGQPEVTSSQ